MKKLFRKLFSNLITVLSILIIGAIFWAITLVVQNAQSVLMHFVNIPLIGILGFVFGISSLKITQSLRRKSRKKRLSKKKSSIVRKKSESTKKASKAEPKDNVSYMPMPPDFDEISGKKKLQKKNKEA